MATATRPRTLRFLLVTLVFASVVPVLIFAVIMGALFEKQELAALEQGRRDTARALSVAVDRDLSASISTLQALAISEHLDSGELKAFYGQAQRVLKAHPGWNTINLVDLSGQQLINLFRPFGAPLPNSGNLPVIRRALDTGEPAISDLFVGPVSGEPIIGITVPVTRGGHLKYVLSAGLDVASLSRLLSESKIDKKWVATITDRKGIILARSRGIEESLGKPAPAAFVTQSERSDEGSVSTVTREGVSVYQAYSRSRLSGWTVGLAVPVAVVETPGRSSLLAVTAGGVVFLLLAGALATVFGRRIARGIGSLSATARALAQGEIPSAAGGSTISEVDDVARQMAEAARERADAIAGRLKAEAALALQNARLYSESDRRRREAEAIAEVGRTISESLDVKEVAQRIADSVRALFRAENAAVFRLERDTEDLATVAGSGDVGPAAPESVTFPKGTGVVGLAVRTRQVVHTEDLLADRRVTLTPAARARVEQASYRAVLAAPLTVMGQVIGALGIGVRPGRVFTTEEIRLIEAFATHAATALENARLYQQTQQAYEDLKRTQDQLILAQKMESIGRLAGGIAHDFNNLLTVISGRAVIATGRLGPGSPAARDLSAIGDATKRASALTRQLLAFGRKQVLQAQVLDLHVVVEGISRMLERTIGEDITITTVGSPDCGRVNADPTQIEQVILNLVVNARDAMPRGGRLTIETAEVELDEAYARTHPEVRPGPYVMVAVSDTGVGMDQATQAQIFEPFFTTKEPGKGTGLGLSTVYGIIKQSGGHIWVYSEPGRGTTFKVYFPRVTEALAVAPPEPVGTTGRGWETILLVEDDEGVRELAQEILEAEGYTVLVASGPNEALGAVARHDETIHLLVTDVVMPQMSGPELVERLRAVRPDIHVLYMSGYADTAIVQHGVLDAGLPFLQKPFTPSVLSRKVREALGVSPRTKRPT
jgi:signal transduction histidine kinase